MHNLFRMSSLASLEGYYFKPRMDRELLQTYGQGLIATTGCPSGEVQTRLRLGQYEEAVAAAAEFRDIFGTENYFCEIMDHGLDIERRVHEGPAAPGQGPRPAAGGHQRPALHQARGRQGPRRAAVRAVRLDARSTPTGSSSTPTSSTSRPPREMRHLFRDHPEACDNTLLIAERCEVSFTEGEGHYMPRFPCPEGENEDVLVRQGGRDAACTTASPTASRTRRASRPSTRSTSSCRWASPATSSSSPTSSTGPRTTASGSARAVARAPAPWRPTPCASPTSTRSSTA